jgi:two-component system, OmpR family, response regulator
VSLVVLYVDHDPARCEVVRAALCPIEDLKVHTAASGEEAIALLPTLRTDLILMDAMSSGLDGSAIFKRMREDPLIDEIPVIFLADDTQYPEIERLMHLGALGVIGKPINPLTVGNELMNLRRDSNNTRARLGAGALAAQISAPIDELAAQFLRRTQDDLNRLNELVNRAVDGDWTILEESVRICHAIRGAAAMFGYPQLSQAAAGMQRSVQDVLCDFTTSPSTHSLAALSLVDGAVAVAQALKGTDQAVPDEKSMFKPRGRNH